MSLHAARQRSAEVCSQAARRVASPRAFCWFYRQPLVFFWTIPGTVLVGPAL